MIPFRHLKNRLTYLCASLGALNCVAGCAVGPDYHKPDISMPANWQTQTSFQPAKPDDARLKGAWWEMFGDVQLNQLEQQALQHNQSLQAAAEHLKQARLQVTVLSAAQLPQVGLQASDARFKTSANRPLASYGSVNQSTVQNNPQLGLAVSYEADVFGRVRRVAESAQAAAAQAAADLENAKLILMAELAFDYVNLRELDAEIDIVRQGVQLQQRALDFIRVRHELDIATGLDLAQQQALLDTNTTQLALLQNQRAALQNALATLTGTAAPDFKLAAQLTTLVAPGMPVGMPADVLQRRPDIASAERAMAIANANIGVARAAYYPTLLLSGSGGWDSNQLSNLVSAPSLLWSLGASMTQTLFDAGKTTANVNIAESTYVAALANYRQSVLVALQEVQTGIDSTTLLGIAQVQSQAAVDSSTRVLELSTARYKGGLDIYLNVISAQQSLLASQGQAIQIRGQQMTNAVYLVKALGGGWQVNLPQAQ